MTGKKLTPNGRPIGRPTRCTPTLTQAIADGLRKGLYFEQACTLAGITPTAGYEWIRRGNGTDQRPTDEPYVQFAEAIAQARAERERACLEAIDAAAAGGFVVERRTEVRNGTTTTTEKYAPPDWRAGAWWLERALQDRWRRTERTEHVGDGGGPVRVEETRFSVLAQRLAQHHGPKVIEGEVVGDEPVGELPAPS